MSNAQGVRALSNSKAHPLELIESLMDDLNAGD